MRGVIMFVGHLNLGLMEMIITLCKYI
jgi:hypothetical protein